MSDANRPGNPGDVYLASRGIPGPVRGVRWIARDDLVGEQRKLCFPHDNYRDGGGPRSQRVGGFPDDIAGVLEYRWWARNLKREFFELEGILPAGTRADWIGTKDGKPTTAKRISQAADKKHGSIHGAAFIVRAPEPFAGGRLHVCEGALDALSLDALGYAQPEDAIIGVHGAWAMRDSASWCAGFAEVWIWPHHLDKDDAVGERCADLLAAALGGRARVVRSKHTERHDLNDELCELAPRRETAGEPEHPFQLLWNYKAIPRPEPILPGLLWHRMHSVIEAGPKWGKTTLLAHVLASVYARGGWLDETCETPGPILYMTEMDPGFLRDWIERFLPDDCRPPIHVAPICKLGELGAAVKAVKPCGVIVDSFIDAFTHDPGKAGADEWKASNVRAWHSRLKEVSPASIMTQHTRKSDGAGRDSGDLHAAVDMVIRMKDEDGKAYFDEPPSAMLGRELHYKGRWSEPVRRVTFDPETGYSPTAPATPKAPLVAHAADGSTRVVPAKHAWLMTHIPDAGGAICRNVLRERAATRPQRFKPALDALLDAGVVVQSGTGRRGDPFRFAQPEPPVRTGEPETVTNTCSGNVHAGEPETEHVFKPSEPETRTRVREPETEQETDRQIQDRGRVAPEGGIAMIAVETERHVEPAPVVDAVVVQPADVAQHVEEPPVVDAPVVQPADVAQSVEEPPVVDTPVVAPPSINGWTGRPNPPPTSTGRPNLWGVPVPRTAVDWNDEDSNLAMVRSGAAAILDRWRLCGVRELLLTEIDEVLHPDAQWLRDTPGGAGDRGEHVTLPNSIAYMRRLTAAEREHERLRMLAAKRACWRSVHAAAMAPLFAASPQA